MNNVIDLTRQMVKINTISRNSNMELIDFLSKVFLDMGFEVKLQDKKFPGNIVKANLVARIGPKDVEPFMFSGHTDTVPEGDIVGWKYDPFNLTSNGGKLYGLGSADMKGPIAAMICAAETLKPKFEKLRREFVFALTHDEEEGLLGAKRLLNKKVVIPKFILVGEPTMLIPQRTHKGHIRLTAFCWGKSGHAGDPRNGLNAIELAAKVIAELQEFAQEVKGIRDPLIDPPYTTLNICAIRADAKLNLIPDYCEIDFAIRPIHGQTTERIQKHIENKIMQIGRDAENRPVASIALYMAKEEREKDEQLWKEYNRKIIEEARKRGKNPIGLKTRQQWIEDEGRRGQKKTNTDPLAPAPSDSEIVRVIEAVSNKKSKGVCYSTDASVLQHFGADCVVFGPGDIYDAHKPNEFIEEQQLLDGVNKFRDIIERICL
jgi:acetylornithine deacetylase